MEIINNNGILELRYKYKINKKVVRRGDEGKYLNKFYLGFLPHEVQEYLKIDKKIYFYKERKEIKLNSFLPKGYNGQSKAIKLQKNNSFSLPSLFFDCKGKNYFYFHVTREGVSIRLE